MESILIIIVVLLGRLIVLLEIPIDLAFGVDRVNNIQGQVNIHWLFGLVRFSINIPDKTKSKKPKSRHKPAAVKKPRNSKESSRSTELIRVLKQSEFRQRLYQFVKDLLHATHSRDLRFHVRIGLGDPADTGRLWIFLGPVAAMAANIRSASIRIEPEFMDPVFELHSKGEFRLMPLEFIVLTLRFILSPAALRAWRTLN